MNMFLHGFDNAVIRWGDTLRNPKLKEDDKLMKFDTVIANPPFSLDKWGAEEAAHDSYNRFWRGIPPKSKGDWAFISHMIEAAQEGSGKVGVVIPHGVLFRGASEGKIRKQVMKIYWKLLSVCLPICFSEQVFRRPLLFSTKGKK